MYDCALFIRYLLVIIAQPQSVVPKNVNVSDLNEFITNQLITT